METSQAVARATGEWKTPASGKDQNRARRVLYDVLRDRPEERPAKPGAAPAYDDQVRLLLVGEPHDLLARLPEHYGSARRYTFGAEYVEGCSRHVRNPCIAISLCLLVSSGLGFMREHASENDFGTVIQFAHDVLRDVRTGRGPVTANDDQRSPGDPLRTADRDPPLTFDVGTAGSDQRDDGDRSHGRRKEQPAEGIAPPPQGQVRDADHRHEHDDQPGDDDFQE